METLCERQRSGVTRLDEVEMLVGALLAEKRTLAADWWTSAADRALALGKLPPSDRIRIIDLRKKVDRENQPAPEARLIWARAGEHIRALIDKKAPRQASGTLALAEQLAAAYPVPGWKIDVITLRERIGKLRDSSGDEKLKESDRTTTTDLASRLQKEMGQRAARALEEFRLYGCQQGIATVDALLRGRPADDAAMAVLKSFRDAARGFGLANDLVIRILGKTRMRVFQDGLPMPLEGTTDDHSFDASEWREIKLLALPGEVIAFELKLPDSAPTFLLKDQKEVRYAELFLSASFDGKDVKRTAWQVGAADQIRAPRPKVGGILFADIGPNRSITVDGEYPICMNYADPHVKPTDNTIVIDPGMSVEELANVIKDSLFSELLSPAMIHYDDEHKAIEAKAKGNRTGFSWVTAVRENPVYFLVVPRADQAK